MGLKRCFKPMIRALIIAPAASLAESSSWIDCVGDFLYRQTTFV